MSAGERCDCSMCAPVIRAGEPPSWCDPTIHLAVYVNGAMIEIMLAGEGWSGWLTVEEAAQIDVAGFAAALAEAQEWASRWDGVERRYRDKSPNSVP